MKKVIVLATFLVAMFVACDNGSIDSGQETGKTESTMQKPGYDFTKAKKVVDVLYQNDEDPKDNLNGVKSWIAYFPSSTDDGLGPAFGTETPGWFYSDSTGCLIYGTWVSWPSGIRIFEPASAATQVLMNDCESAKDVA